MIPSPRQYKQWSLPSKWSFLAAVIGIPLGAISLAVSSWPLFSADPEIAERTRLVLQVAQELRYNHEWLSRLALVHRNKETTIPVGALKTDTLIALIQRHHDWVIQEAYGEEKYLYQHALLLRDLSIRLGSPSTRVQVTAFDADSNYSMHDVHFLNNFILWYLTPLIQDNLNERQLYSLGWFGLPSNAFSIDGVPVLHMKYFLTDGVPITEYSDYLSLID